MKNLRVILCAVVLAISADRVSATVLFSDNFNTTGSAAGWTTNAFPGANAGAQDAVFAFDYSAFGIPPAPGGSDTLGLRLRANIPGGAAAPVTTRPAGALSGLSVSPVDRNFGTNYRLTFYAWSNFIGGPNAQGLADVTNSEGGTANVLFAVGTNGTTALVAGQPNAIAGSTMDGVAFATTGDGGIASDYRAFPASGTANITTMLAAGTADNSNTFYASKFPSRPAPAIQQTLSTQEYSGDAANTQAGLTQAGSFGFAWHKVVLTKNNDVVTWDIDNMRFATVDASVISLGGQNIALGVSDVNTSTTRHPSLVFTVFDNLVVSDVPTLPGDFNASGVVDGNDLTKWSGDFGTNPGSDHDGDGVSGGGDFNIWQQAFNPPAAAPASNSVPEPAAGLLASLAMAGLIGRRRTAH